MRYLAPCTAVATFLLATAHAQDVPSSVTYEREVTYLTGDPAWRLDYARPKDSAEPTPAIVVIHGGGWIEGDKSSYDQLIVDWAGLGFFAMTINYRLANKSVSTFPRAIEDCKCTVRWLRAHATQYNIDPARIGAYGSSAGGHLALMLGILGGDAGKPYEGDGPFPEQSSEVVAVASDSGIVTLDMALPENQVLQRVFMHFLGGNPPAAERVRAASPLTYVEGAAKWPPMLLVYGAEDTQVPIVYTEQFVEALRARHHPDLTYRRYEDAGHCPFFMEHVPGAREEVERFFTRVLRPTR